MLRINQLDLKREYNSTEEELKATKSYLYQLVEELRYRFDDKEEPVEPGRTEEEVIGEAVRASYKYIDAKGVSADWINTGILKDSNSNFYWNLDTGVLRTDSMHLQLADHQNQSLNEYIEALKEDLEDQIDGNVTQWFYAYEPTLQNAPAVDWTTTDLKNQHLGDLFYDTSTGYSYRFMQDDFGYKWQRISDSDITRALEAAARAQDTADGKRRVFIVQPTPPYDAGDLWSDGEDIYRCITARASGSYLESDWEMASSYREDIGGLQTDLDIQAGLISSKVSQTDYTGATIASLIEQSPASVKISASHIELTGQNIADRLNAASSSVIIGAGHLDLSSRATVESVQNMSVTVSNHETRITQNTTNIASKASSSSVNALTTRVTNAESTITQHSTQIASKVSTTTFNALKSRMDTAESSITQNANNIKLKVSTSDYTGAKMVSMINQSADSVQIEAKHVKLTGYVTVNNLKTPGSTVIDGGNVNTGTIKGAYIVLGGNKNGNGTLTVYDAKGSGNNEIALILDNDGLNIKYIYGSANTQLARIGAITQGGRYYPGVASGQPTLFMVKSTANVATTLEYDFYADPDYGIWLRRNGVRRAAFNWNGMYIYDASQHARCECGWDGLTLRDANNYKRVWMDLNGVWFTNEDNTTKIKISGTNGNIQCVSLTQTSIAEAKKNIVAIPQDAIRLLMDTDIYQYSMKNDDTDRKRYGVIVNGGYNCCDEIKDTDGVDIYSMISVLWQAVKEQQKEISKLKGDM